jgi:hypothetical protein
MSLGFRLKSVLPTVLGCIARPHVRGSKPFQWRWSVSAATTGWPNARPVRVRRRFGRALTTVPNSRALQTTCSYRGGGRATGAAGGGRSWDWRPWQRWRTAANRSYHSGLALALPAIGKPMADGRPQAAAEIARRQPQPTSALHAKSSCMTGAIHT